MVNFYLFGVDMQGDVGELAGQIKASHVSFNLDRQNQHKTISGERSERSISIDKEIRFSHTLR